MESIPGKRPHEIVAQEESPEVEKPMTLVTVIPDKSIVASQLSLLEQRVFVDFDELEGYLEWIDQFPDEESVRKAILLTINNLSAENTELWDAASQEDKIYTLGECIREKMCTCFHRSSMFNVLMNRRNVNCVTLDGRVLEASKETLHSDPKIAPILAKNALQLGEEEETAFEDAHVWNVIQRNGGKYYLIDTSFLIEGKPVVHEIDFDNTDRNTFTVQLPDGRFRHYLSTGMLSVQRIELAEETSNQE